MIALFPISSIKLFRVLYITLACLLAAGALAACGSDPEPDAISLEAPASANDAATQPAAPVPQTVLEPAPATDPAVPVPQAEPEPEPTPLPTATPLVVIPSPTRAANMARAGGSTAVNDSGPQAPAATAPTAGDAALPDIGPETTWGDIFDSFSEEEQSCIRSEMGEERLDRILEQPFVAEGPEDEPVTVLNCISEDKAREILLASMAAQFGGLNEEQITCLRGLLANFSPADLASAMGPEPTPDQALLTMSFGLGMVACVPELMEGGGPGGPLDGSGPPSGVIQDDSLLWSFITGGWVVTAPAVVNGVVYIGSDDHSLYALDGNTGFEIWSFATGDVIRSTPTVVDGRVFFGSNDNHLYALDAATGQELWKYDTGDWVQYSPAVNNGRVYFAAPSEGDRKVHAVDAATGEVAWVAEHPFPIGAEHTPTPIGDKIYAPGAEYGQFYALDATTGETTWQAEVGGYVESAPTVLDGMVYLTVANRAYAFDESTGEIIWEVNTEEFPARDFPALVSDGVYYLAPSDYVYALDAATGMELWSYESYMLSTAPVVADGVLYGASGDAEYIFALDAKSGAELWTETTEDFTTNALSVVDGVLYGELNNGYLFAADAGDGFQVWGFEKGGFSDVRGYTVQDGVIYSAGSNNGVYAHRAP